MFTTNQITSALAAYRSAADQDTATASSIAAALLSYYTIAQVDGLLAGKLGVTEAASALQIAVRFPDDGGADEVVAAIILSPTDVSLSNWTVRPSSGCRVLATHTAGVSVDGYTLTLAANSWNIVRTYNLTPSFSSPTADRLSLKDICSEVRDGSFHLQLLKRPLFPGPRPSDPLLRIKVRKVHLQPSASPWGAFIPRSETDLSASSPVSASPENKKNLSGPRRIIAEKRIFRVIWFWN